MGSTMANLVEWLNNWYYGEDEVDSLLSNKQDTLISGSNIKTVNDESLLGSGNITTFTWTDYITDLNTLDGTGEFVDALDNIIQAMTGRGDDF